MNAIYYLNRDKDFYLVFHKPSGDVAATISLRMGSKEFLMKNFVNDYLEDTLEDEDVFERFGRKGKLPPKEGQRPRRGAQDAIKDKRRAREAEREQMTKDYIE